MKVQRQRLVKLASFLFWLSLIAGFWWYVRHTGLSPSTAVQQLVDFAGRSILGPIIYVLFYVVQPIIFFPSSLLSVAAGYLFGPVWGSLLAVIGSNGSAVIAYLVGRYFGGSFFKSDVAQRLLDKYAPRLHCNSFEAVLVMRLIFLPYDLVSYLAGFLRVSLGGFVMGTFVGGLAGSVSFVLFGASIEGNFTGQRPTLDPWALGAAAGLFIVSVAISRYLRMRERQDTPPQEPQVKTR